MNTPTPRTDAIRKLIRDAINETDRERQIAMREGAECGIEQLERDLAARDAELARVKEQADKFKWQVRDTCQRAERAEAERDAAREQAARSTFLANEWEKRAGQYMDERNAAIKDAERYRWLRGQRTHIASAVASSGFRYWWSIDPLVLQDWFSDEQPMTFDDAIDAAREGK